MEKSLDTDQFTPAPVSERRKIISLYIAFFGSIFMGVIPSLYISILSIIFLSLTLLALYMTRREAEEDSLSESHAHFLIRTFWNANLFFVVFVVFSILYFLMFVRLASINPCVSTLIDNIELIAKSADTQILLHFMHPCEAEFMLANKTTIGISTFIAFFPVLFYLLIRFVRGWSRVIKNQNI